MINRKLKRFRIVAGPAGSQTKCPICELLICANTSPEVGRLLQQHLRTRHSKAEQEKANAMVIKVPRATT